MGLQGNKLAGKGDLHEMHDFSLQDILMDLLDGEQNLDLKTHIKNPQALAALKLISKFLKMESYTGSAKLLKKYITIYLRYMVSLDRESRKEIIQAVSSLLNRETLSLSLGEKLTTKIN